MIAVVSAGCVNIKSQGVLQVDFLLGNFCDALEFIDRVCESQLPSAVFQAAQRSTGPMGSQTLAEELSPVVRRNPAERIHDFFECIGHDFRKTVLATVEFAAKVIERLLTPGFAADDGVCLEPDQRALIVVISPATPRRAGRAHAVKNL